MAQSSIKKNFIMNALLTMSSFIFPLITFPYVSRVLGPTGTGKVSFATSFISYFSMVAQLGIPTYGIRACARVRDNREELTRTAQELLLVNLIMDAFSYAALIIALLTVPRLQEDRTLYVVVSATILLTSIGMEWLYKALEQYTYITVRSVIFKFIALLAMFALVRSEEDYVFYGFTSILASSASNIFNFINVHRYIDLKPVGHYNLKRHLKPTAVFFAMTVASTFYTHLDTVMLGFMVSDTDVGYYNAAIRIKSILVSIVTSLGAVLLPRASYYVEHRLLDDFKRITKKALNFVCVVAAAMMLYFMLFAREGILLLSGRKYIASIVPMQIIMPTLLFIGITNILGMQMLVPLGREMVVLKSEVAGAVIDVIINALLIPKYLSSGAAVGTLAAEFLVLVVQVYYMHGERGVTRLPDGSVVDPDISGTFRSIHYVRILIALALGTAASVWVKAVNWPFKGELRYFVMLAVSAVLFFGVYGGFLLWRREQIAVEMWQTVTKKLKRK